MKFVLIISATATIAIMTIGPLVAEETSPSDHEPSSLDGKLTTEQTDESGAESAEALAKESTREAGTSLPSITARRTAARTHLARLNDEKRYDEAIGVALQILRLTQEEFGEDSSEVIDPLVGLAVAQRNGADLPTAALNLSTAVTLIEKHHGPLSEKLIGPLTALGDIYNESGQFRDATQTFDRALRLNHVNQGFTNFEQFPIMDSLTASHLSLSDIPEATFYQTAQLEIQQRRLGINDPDTAPAYYKLARWYNRIYHYDDALLTYRRADRIVRDALGHDSPKRAEGLQGIALVYQNLGNRSQSSRTLRKALQLVEDSADNDPLQRAAILVSLGDSLTREGKFSAARDQYAAAWHALPNDEAGDERRKFYFDRSVRLEGGLYPRYARKARGRPADQLSTGSILINYAIDARGRVTDASVIESDPPGLLDRSFLSIYRQSLFRPHYAEGTAQARNGRRIKHQFLYVNGDTERDDNTDSSAKPSKKRGKLSYPGND